MSRGMSFSTAVKSLADTLSYHSMQELCLLPNTKKIWWPEFALQGTPKGREKNQSHTVVLWAPHIYHSLHACANTEMDDREIEAGGRPHPCEVRNGSGSAGENGWENMTTSCRKNLITHSWLLSTSGWLCFLRHNCVVFNYSRCSSAQALQGTSFCYVFMEVCRINPRWGGLWCWVSDTGSSATLLKHLASLLLDVHTFKGSGVSLA